MSRFKVGFLLLERCCWILIDHHNPNNDGRWRDLEAKVVSMKIGML